MYYWLNEYVPSYYPCLYFQFTLIYSLRKLVYLPRTSHSPYHQVSSHQNISDGTAKHQRSPSDTRPFTIAGPSHQPVQTHVQSPLVPHAGDLDQTIHDPIPTWTQHDSTETHILREWDRQIVVLKNEIDAFRAERDLLAEAVSKQRSVRGLVVLTPTKVMFFYLEHTSGEYYR